MGILFTAGSRDENRFRSIELSFSCLWYFHVFPTSEGESREKAFKRISVLVRKEGEIYLKLRTKGTRSQINCVIYDRVSLFRGKMQKRVY